MICRFRDYGSSTVITAETSSAGATATPSGAPELPASLAAAIDAQARRVDQLSAAILRATAQVTWSGRAADRFRALRASAERVHAAASAGTGVHAAAASAGHATVSGGQAGLVGQAGQAGQAVPALAGHEAALSAAHLAATATLERVL